MADLSRISDAELLFDRQECFNDIVSCMIAREAGVTHSSSGSTNERIKTNARMIDIITKECNFRGFDPAQHDQVKLRL